jgi:hypothetical protein
VGYSAIKAGLGCGALKLRSEGVGGYPPSLVGEQELDQFAGAGMAQWTSRAAVGDDAVNDLDGLLVEGNHPFREQLAEGNLQPCSLAGDLVHAVQLQVDQLADAQPGGP